MSEQADRLTSQLYHLPAIIGRLGLSIANAQKELNIDYVNSMARLMELIRETVGKDAAADIPVVSELLKTLAPSRYQFTETTIEFSADLAESMQAKGEVGIGIGTKAVMVNAALTIGYGYDYRASARITSVLHARPVGPDMAADLLQRKDKIDSAKLALPERNQLDENLFKAVSGVYAALGK